MFSPHGQEKGLLCQSHGPLEMGSFQLGREWRVDEHRKLLECQSTREVASVWGWTSRVWVPRRPGYQAAVILVRSLPEGLVPPPRGLWGPLHPLRRRPFPGHGPSCPCLNVVPHLGDICLSSSTVPRASQKESNRKGCRETLFSQLAVPTGRLTADGPSRCVTLQQVCVSSRGPPPEGGVVSAFPCGLLPRGSRALAGPGSQPLRRVQTTGLSVPLSSLHHWGSIAKLRSGLQGLARRKRRRGHLPGKPWSFGDLTSLEVRARPAPTSGVVLASSWWPATAC